MLVSRTASVGHGRMRTAELDAIAIVWGLPVDSEYGGVRASAREVYGRDKAGPVGMLNYACS